MMILRSALRRELSSTAGTVFVALFSLTLTMILVRLLGRAAGGKVDTELVVPLIALQALGFLPVLISLTVYVAVMAALVRYWRDSEMVVWFSSGASVLSWVRPVLSFALPFAALVAVLSFVVSPWAQRQTESLRARFEQRDDTERVAPGQFRESDSGTKVFFVEMPAEVSGRVGNIFIAISDGEKQSVVVSSTGRIESDSEGRRFAVLEDGRRYDGVLGQRAWREASFDEYRVLADQQGEEKRVDNTVRALTMSELVAGAAPVFKGELAWRLGLPIASVLLPLLAIPLSAMNVRAGRSLNLIFALLVYVLYSNCLSLMQAYIVQGKSSFEMAVWPVHVGFAVLLVYLFWRRMQIKPSWFARAWALVLPTVIQWSARFKTRKVSSSERVQ